MVDGRLAYLKGELYITDAQSALLCLAADAANRMVAKIITG
jgi:hypothetical protein